MARLMSRDTSQLSGLVITVAMTLLACSDVDPAGPINRPDLPQPPLEFTSRTALPSCGSATAEDAASSASDVLLDSAMDCLNRARASLGAEFRSTTITTEGDPITTYYRVRPRTIDVEVFVDHTRDAFSSAGWTHYTCPAIAVSRDALRQCGAQH
ncbi:MAG: hypothetical protein PGN29_15695 [Gordonia paraffinivorans]